MSARADAWDTHAGACPFHNESGVPRRPVNGLNVEIGAPHPRCTARPPGHWPEKPGMVLRWLGSGGSPLVFGLCAPAGCPCKDEWPDSLAEAFGLRK